MEAVLLLPAAAWSRWRCSSSRYFMRRSWSACRPSTVRTFLGGLAGSSGSGGAGGGGGGGVAEALPYLRGRSLEAIHWRKATRILARSRAARLTTVRPLSSTIRSLEGSLARKAPATTVPGAAASVIDDVEGFLEERLGLALLGEDVHFLEVGVIAQPAENGGDAGQVGGLAEAGHGLRGGGDALADECGEVGRVADFAFELGLGGWSLFSRCV